MVSTFGQLEIGDRFELRYSNQGSKFTKLEPVEPLNVNAKTWDEEGRQSYWVIEESEEVIVL